MAVRLTIVVVAARQLEQARSGRRAEPGVIALPHRAAPRDHGIGVHELRLQKRSNELARQVRRTDVHPAVFVDFATQEGAAVGAFFANDFGARDEARVVDEQCAAFAAEQVLGFMEAYAAELTDGTE